MVSGVNEFGFVYENEGFFSPSTPTGFKAPKDQKKQPLSQAESESLKNGLNGTNKKKSAAPKRQRRPQVREQYNGTIKYKNITYKNAEMFKRFNPDVRVITLAQQAEANQRRMAKAAGGGTKVTNPQIPTAEIEQQVQKDLQKQFAQQKNPLLQSVLPNRQPSERLIPAVEPQPLTPEEIEKYKKENKKGNKKEKYQPTEEQIEAQKARRAQQREQANQRKRSRYGGRTEYNKETGKWEPVKKRPSLQEKLKTASPEVQNRYAQRFGKPAKVGKYLKKGGKVGLILGAIALAGAGIYSLFKGGSKDETAPVNQAEKPAKKNNQERVADKNDTSKGAGKADNADKAGNTGKAVVGKAGDDAAKAGAKDPSKTGKTPEQKEQSKPELFLPLDKDGNYTTIKNDSFWKIAEKYLKDQYKARGLDKKPTNAEIQRETERIMEQNGYKYDSNHWFSDPMLQPDTKLVIKAKLDKAA